MNMPIVNVNQMSMNESVAATCCYQAVQVNGQHYENVLHGGHLTTKVGNELNYAVDKSWVAFVNDYEEALSGHQLVKAYDANNDVWNYGYYNGTLFVKLSDLTAYLSGCDHQGDYCNYIDYIGTTFEKVHAGATVEHAAAKDWAATHTAVRFNS